MHMISYKINYGEMLIKTKSTMLLEIFFHIMSYSKVVLKTVADPDGASYCDCSWGMNGPRKL